VELNREVDAQVLMRRTIRQLLASPDHELELASLLALTSDDNQLRIVAEQELAPRNAHLELHLAGSTVVGHATVAKSFGQFVLQMAESVKVTVRDISGSGRLNDELLIEAGPGSVKTTFIAPLRTNPSATMDLGESADEVSVEEDGYSEALRRVSTVLANSDPESPDSAPLDAAISLIPAASRAPLRRALDEAHKQSWSIEGTFSQRGLGITPVAIHPRAVTFLRQRLTETVVTRDSSELTGHLDGHTWSSGTMRFIPIGGSRPIVALFGDTGVQIKVGQLDSKPDQKVRVRLQIVTTSGLASTRKSYVLESIEAIEESIAPDLFTDETGMFDEWRIPPR
jgi:hypothetical protein